MGIKPNAVLAYGVHVDDDFGYGEQQIPWLGDDDDFDEALERVVHESIKVRHLGEDAGYIIAVHEFRTDWDQVLTIEHMPSITSGMNYRLAEALKALGVTNVKPPSWMLAAYQR